VTRALCSASLCAGALVAGLATVWLCARNRARGAELDSVQRWCEIFARQNEALRSEIRAAEWELLDAHAAPVAGAPGQAEAFEPWQEVER
jgi:hypothetical protein